MSEPPTDTHKRQSPGSASGSDPMREPRRRHYQVILADPPWDWRTYSKKIIAPVRGHSVKPDEVYERIEALVDGPYLLELFGRQRRFGWDAWGREVDASVGKRRWRSDSFPGAGPPNPAC